MYFEDVDICKRAKNFGLKVAQAKKIFAVHDAQRKSYKNAEHFIFHMKSYILYIRKHLLI